VERRRQRQMCIRDSNYFLLSIRSGANFVVSSHLRFARIFIFDRPEAKSRTDEIK
jgi:hypothetical protein